jgi:hypothetical protein
MARRADAVPAKRDGLVVQSIDQELIVYDPHTHQAHSLNRAAAAVFQHVDGKTPTAEIAGKLGLELRGASGERVVRVALDRLGAVGLLNPAVNPRRRAIVRGLAAALVPVVTSVVVPKAAAALSCIPPGSFCSGPTPCCYGHTCTGVPTPRCG